MTAAATAAMTAEERDKLAQQTAEHIAGRRSGPNKEGTFGTPPRTIPEIRDTLLGGHVWISWLDDTVTAAMRRLHGEPSGNAGFLVEGTYSEPVRVTSITSYMFGIDERGRYDDWTHDIPCVLCGAVCAARSAPGLPPRRTRPATR